jgi:hypothetical protein
MSTLNQVERALSAALACALTSTVLAQTPAVPAPASKSLAASAGLLAYPAKGQSADQQTKDEAECYNWAKTQSGYDPMSPPPPPTAAPAQPAQASGPSGARVRGAARGAAAGAIVGEVADNDADKGAAVGAAAGVVAGGRQARHQQAQQQEKAQEQAQASQAQAKAAQDALAGKFKSGMTVCLEAKGYTVK